MHINDDEIGIIEIMVDLHEVLDGFHDIDGILQQADASDDADNIGYLYNEALGKAKIILNILIDEKDFVPNLHGQIKYRLGIIYQRLSTVNDEFQNLTYSIVYLILALNDFKGSAQAYRAKAIEKLCFTLFEFTNIGKYDIEFQKIHDYYCELMSKYPGENDSLEGKQIFFQYKQLIGGELEDEIEMKDLSIPFTEMSSQLLNEDYNTKMELQYWDLYRCESCYFLAFDDNCPFMLKSYNGMNYREMKHLLRVSLRDKNWLVQLRTIDLIGEFRSDFFLSMIKNHIYSNEPKIATATINAMKKIGGENAAMLIANCLYHESRKVQDSTIEALIKMNCKRLQMILILNVLSNDWKIRFSSAWLLRMYCDESTEHMLLSLLNDENRFVKWKAIESLGFVGSERSIKYLMSLIGEPEMKISACALKTVERIAKKQRFDINYNSGKSVSEKKMLSSHSLSYYIKNKLNFQNINCLDHDSIEKRRKRKEQIERRIAIEKMRETKQDEKHRKLREAKQDEQQKLRLSKMVNLDYSNKIELNDEKIRVQKSIKVIFEEILITQDVAKQEKLIFNLGKMKCSDSWESIKILFTNDDPNIRYFAIMASMYVSSDEVFQYLEKLLQDDDIVVSNGAHNALVLRGRKQSNQ